MFKKPIPGSLLVVLLLPLLVGDVAAVARQPQFLCVRLGPGGNCIKIGLPGKSILGYYFQENWTSQRPFLLLRISFPRRPIFRQFVPEVVEPPAADAREEDGDEDDLEGVRRHDEAPSVEEPLHRPDDEL